MLFHVQAVKQETGIFPTEDFFSDLYSPQGFATLFKMVNNPKGINQYTGKPKKTPAAAEHVLNAMGGKNVELNKESHSYSGSHLAADAGEANKRAVAAGKALESQGFKRLPGVKAYKDTKFVEYVNEHTGATAQVLRTAQADGKVELRFLINHPQKYVEREEPKPKVNTAAMDKLFDGGKNTPGTSYKKYTADAASQLALHQAVHKDLKSQGYNAGPKKSGPASYLYETKYTAADKPDVLVHTHTPAKIKDKGGKVEVTIKGMQTGLPASTTAKPITYDKPATKPAGTTTPSYSAPKKPAFPEPSPDDGDHQPLKPGSAKYSVFTKHHQDQLAVLGASHRAALKAYTGSSYSSINKYMRGKPDGEPTKQTISRAKLITAALNASTVGVTTMLYRSVPGNTGLNMAKAVENGTILGQVLTDAGAMSTSTRAGMAEYWNGSVVLQIKAKPTTKGLFVKSISQHSSEDEVMLAPNTKLVVTEVKKTGSKHWLTVEPIGP